MKFSIRSVAAAAGFALAIGSAYAAPTFTVNPNSIPGNTFATAPFSADTFSGTSSELLTLNATGNSGSGWAQISGASLGSTSLSPLVTGFGVDYNLYLTFTLDTTLLTGVNGASGSTYSLNSLSFQVWADPGIVSGSATANATTFTAANSSGTGTAASIGGVTSDDILLGFGSLLAGTADITSLGGAALNAINTFGVCNGTDTASIGGLTVPAVGCTTAGTNFFVSPTPFYALAMSGFNNASGGVTKNGDLVAVNSAVAAITFNDVPEPGSIALLGLALAGLGVTTRRTKKNSSI